MKRLMFVLAVMLIFLFACTKTAKDTKPVKIMIKSTIVGTWRISKKSYKDALFRSTGVHLKSDGTYDHGRIENSKMFDIDVSGTWSLDNTTIEIIFGNTTNCAKYKIVSQDKMIITETNGNLSYYIRVE